MLLKILPTEMVLPLLCKPHSTPMCQSLIIKFPDDTSRNGNAYTYICPAHMDRFFVVRNSEEKSDRFFLGLSQRTRTDLLS